MADEQKLTTLLGFANRAGKLALGRSAIAKNSAKKRVYLIITAKDVSAKVLKEFSELIKKMPSYSFSTKEELGKICGRDQVGIIGVCDQQFASSIRKLMHNNDRLKSRVDGV